MKISERKVGPRRSAPEPVALPERYDIVEPVLELSEEQIIPGSEVSARVSGLFLGLFLMFFVVYQGWLGSAERERRLHAAFSDHVDMFCLYRNYQAFTVNVPECGVTCNQQQSLQLIAASEANNFALVTCGEPMTHPQATYSIIQASLPSANLNLIEPLTRADRNGNLPPR